MSDRVFEFACDAYKELIANLVDDCSWLLHPDREKEPPEAIMDLRQLGRELGLDYDAIVAASGSASERETLRKVEVGEIKPEPKGISDADKSTSDRDNEVPAVRQ